MHIVFSPAVLTFQHRQFIAVLNKNEHILTIEYENVYDLPNLVYYWHIMMATFSSFCCLFI